MSAAASFSKDRKIILPMIAALPHLLDMMNGAEGNSDIEGKATRVGASERGQRTSFNLRQGDTFNAPEL